MPFVEAEGDPIKVDAVSAPVVTDWNDDGLLDLLIGCASPGGGYGTIQIYVNRGTQVNPLFLRPPGYVMCGPYAVVESYTKPGYVDVTRDGLEDIVFANGSARFYYMENVGTSSEPLFTSIDSMTSQGTAIDLTFYGSMHMVDWDGDGFLDLLAGDFSGQLFLYRGSTTGIGTWPGPPGTVSLEVLGNPSRDRVTVSLSTDVPLEVELSLYSLDGRLVETLFSGTAGQGEHIISSGNLDCAGSYLVRALSSSGGVSVRRALVLP